jgi:hypothetical protein
MQRGEEGIQIASWRKETERRLSRNTWSLKQRLICKQPSEFLHSETQELAQAVRHADEYGHWPSNICDGP